MAAVVRLKKDDARLDAGVFTASRASWSAEKNSPLRTSATAAIFVTSLPPSPGKLNEAWQQLRRHVVDDEPSKIFQRICVGASTGP